jgi:hypothetical protein
VLAWLRLGEVASRQRGIPARVRSVDRRGGG